MRFLIGMIILGAVLTFASAKKVLLAIKTSDTPAALTCAQLFADGPGDNLHLALEEVIAYGDWYVYASKTGNEDGPYDHVYLPFLPVGGQWHQSVLANLDEEGNLKSDVAPPTDIRIIAKFNDVSDPHKLARLIASTEYRGVVINDIKSLDAEERKLLAQGYPGVDFKKCWIFEVGRKPDGMTTPILSLVGGIALMGGGIFLLRLGKFRPKHKKPPTVPKTTTDHLVAETTVPPAEDALSAPADDNPYAKTD